MNVNILLDDAKVKLGVDTDYKLFKMTDITENRLSDYRKGKALPDNFACFKLAEILGEDPIKLIAEFEAENNRSERKRLFFKDFLTTVGLWITLAVIPLFLGAHSESAFAAGKAVVIDIKTHYTK